MESVILCLIGGIIGLILGIGLATLIDFVTPDMIKSSVSLGSVLLAVSVSTPWNHLWLGTSTCCG